MLLGQGQIDDIPCICLYLLRGFWHLGSTLTVYASCGVIADLSFLSIAVILVAHLFLPPSMGGLVLGIWPRCGYESTCIHDLLGDKVVRTIAFQCPFHHKPFCCCAAVGPNCLGHGPLVFFGTWAFGADRVIEDCHCNCCQMIACWRPNVCHCLLRVGLPRSMPAMPFAF